MTISISDTFTHRASCEKKINPQEKELKQLVTQTIEKIGLNEDQVQWSKSGDLRIKEKNNLKLHTLMLQMEKLGLELKMTKQTVIEIC